VTLAIKHLKDATKAANLICTFCMALACLNDCRGGKTTNKTNRNTAATFEKKREKRAKGQEVSLGTWNLSQIC